LPFILYAQEEANPWGADARETAERVLSLFEDNPFAPLAEADLKLTLKFEPYDHRRVLDELAHNPEAGIAVRTTSPFYLDGGLSRHPVQNGVSFGGDPEYLRRDGAPAAAAEYVKRWRQTLPAFDHAALSADDRENVFFFDDLDLEPLPNCFGNFLGWYHVISPRGYAASLDAETLRRTPAHKVEELPDGAFAITTYPDPLDFAGAEATRRIVEITNYLNERRKD
jgi:hypothetical protein